MTSTITRFAAGMFIAAGLAVGGSLGMADVAFADSSTSSEGNSNRPKTSTEGHSNRQNTTVKRDRQAQVGLNGTLPQRPVTTRPDQFKHLPFNPAMPGGD